MVLSRSLVVPLVAVIGVALIDGVVASGGSLFGHFWTIWLIVGGLAALVIVTLAAQIEAACDVFDPMAEAHFTYVDGQTLLVATALIVVGVAVFLGTCIPDALAGLAREEVRAFGRWVGSVTIIMGFALAIARGTVGTRSGTMAAAMPEMPSAQPQEPPAHDAAGRAA